MVVLALVLGGGIVLATLVAAGPAGAAFPGANGEIFFASDRTTGPGVVNPEGDGEIFAMQPDGTGLRQLTKNGSSDTDPAVSADGRRVAYMSCETGCGDAPTLHTMNADGTGQKLVDENESFNPAWSPNGEWIVYALNDYVYGSYALAKIRPDGSGKKIIVRQKDYGYGPTDPAWSPNGKKIAYAGYTKDKRSDIFTVRPDGSDQTNLTRDSAYDYSPNWAPDGTKIVFSSGVFAKSDPYDFLNVYKMKPDGSGKVRLTSETSDSADILDREPAFSPDGDQITFMRNVRDCRRCSTAEVYKMNADGSQETNLTGDPAYDSYPDWQPLAQPLP